MDERTTKILGTVFVVVHQIQPTEFNVTVYESEKDAKGFALILKHSSGKTARIIPSSFVPSSQKPVENESSLEAFNRSKREENVTEKD